MGPWPAYKPESDCSYKYAGSSFFSKATFFWLLPLFRGGYKSPLELEDLGNLPYSESTEAQYRKFKSVYFQEKVAAHKEKRPISLWKCYFRSCWYLFLCGGIFKLLGDMVGFVGPLGISVIIDYVTDLQIHEQIKNGSQTQDTETYCMIYFPTWDDFVRNGYIMGCIVLIAAIAQGTLSQCSTHIVNIEGIRLKNALQALVYKKSLQLCVWAIREHKDEHEQQPIYLRKSGGLINSHNAGIKEKRPESSHGLSNGTVKHTMEKHVKCQTAVDTGTITNLMSEDSFNIMSFFWIGHYIWAIPLKIAVLMYLLYTKLGISALIGSAVCIMAMTPLQLFVGKKMSVNSKSITEISDERLRKINEILQGIKLLKLYGWEDIYASKILETRRKELFLLNKESLYWAIMTFLTHASSVLVTLVTFGACFLMEEPLTPANVFAGLALFNQLTVPLFIFPVTVPIIISAVVSTRRLQEFLSLPETGSGLHNHQHYIESKTVFKNLGNRNITNKGYTIMPVSSKNVNSTLKLREEYSDSVFSLHDIPESKEWQHTDEEDGTDDNEDEEDDNADDVNEDAVRKTNNKESVVSGDFSNSETDTVVSVRNGVFSWSEQSRLNTLTLTDVTIPKGKLTVIVGTVGSGKSSLLSAILGEMHTMNGKVSWTSGATIAYSSQKPWLLNATLRENILFGQPYRPRRYQKVISACALEPDIDLLPGKDLTEIGEKGITLSGGQKQRIAVARALYCKAHVVILDDPLSALDYQVGKQVFTEGVKKLLLRQKRTVILVTHRLQLLSYADKIIALEKGRIRAQGTLKDIESIDKELVKSWRTVMNREALEEKKLSKSHTAKERWQLIRLISRFGMQLKQQRVKDNIWQSDAGCLAGLPQFVPFRKQKNAFGGSRHLTHDLPLPTDEYQDEFICPNEQDILRGRRARASTLIEPPARHKAVLRMSSLQANRTVENIPFPVMRQLSSPAITNGQFIPILSRPVPITPPAAAKDKGVLKKLASSTSFKSTTSVTEQEQQPARRLLSTTSSLSDDLSEDDDLCDETAENSGRLASDEEREYGKIPKKLYIEYLKACGILVGGTYLILTFSWQGLRIYTDYWLSEWSEQADAAVDNFENQASIAHYFQIYAGLSILSIVLSLSSNAIGQLSGSRARRILHEAMLFNILKCPLKFFETTPVGRIINRFSTDTNVIDKKIAISIQRLVQFLLLCVSAIFVNAIVTPWFLLIAVPICIIYYVVQRFYRCSSRELQRLDSITRSPIFSHFSETLGGLTTIRAFNHQQRFADLLFKRMDCHTNVFLIMNAGNRWLGIALDYLGAVIVFIAIIAALISVWLYPNYITPALVGLAVNYTLLVPIYLNWVVKFLADMEMYMCAVERVHKCAVIPTEDYRYRGIKVPKNWPMEGDIVFEDVSLRYDSGSQPVIHNLNLHIPAGQKLGICGRTGSGKSSLVMSLFHMVEVHEGTIKIDGLDISLVPLQVLRSRLSVIPQDVIMFSGSIRENLDPSAQFTDAELWKSLELAQLKETVSSYPGKLDAEVQEGGENLSAGERQLFCLARAILHGAACLIMDEATSSVDPETEEALLAAASKAFAGRTVITIAHRLRTILNCDRILVLDSGRIVEDGTPTQLLSRSMGIFSSLLRAAEEDGICT
ncbi:ATP-binding cassette sub-family C member Sur [Schistocerca americana]|uniref:ATP-binding cassette sub-family C member Sur n=1 Tax=Schistocerca americana TaxID=7009 RepID=UPI001F4F4B64|nr:ATP-binding cassette sub-family C member Sur [Schistocerca americana]